MEIAAAKLEALVKQADVSIDTILLELELELTKRIGVQLKPAQIISSIQELQQELEDIKRISKEHLQKHNEVEGKFKNELDIACKKIMDLQTKSDCSGSSGDVLSTRLATLEI